MAQEQFAGPEYHTSFDPEKFIRDLKAQADAEAEAAADENESHEDDAEQQ
ncbi:hypothetical protein [Corynebacterium lubricantis]|nr:hypothetical protein [Corynebacterium lubricantis]